jgi:2-hydroxy-3-keto-5-methylthiopentenyl-1-phosphate phosphatase
MAVIYKILTSLIENDRKKNLIIYKNNITININSINNQYTIKENKIGIEKLISIINNMRNNVNK